MTLRKDQKTSFGVVETPSWNNNHEHRNLEDFEEDKPDTTTDLLVNS